ncbi:hypothetical protein GCM10008018_04390 [Paenibacillus marchantiophytorum]|uniref:Uncharacterized protein n=1 Tax=Paenibacillus marchantiophytorum TaxID=1619310 RepID=A0ABQ2BNI6_9BACL|nr:hypothetical protein GCM10008018_04390 [Paenibacillus marchantiophytorum]
MQLAYYSQASLFYKICPLYYCKRYHGMSGRDENTFNGASDGDHHADNGLPIATSDNCA